jgi:hypothetical protein
LKSRGSHIIQKAHLKLKVGDQKHAYEVQSQVITLFQQQGIPALERELDRLVPADQMITLDRLELDLGNIRLEELREKLPQLLALKVQEELGRLMAEESAASKAAKLERVDDATADLEILMRFLETGTLGWEVDQSSRSPQQLFARLLESQPMVLKAAIARRLANPNFRARLSLQFSLEQVRQLLSLFGGDGTDHWVPLLDDLMTGLEGISTEFQAFPSSAATHKAMAVNWIWEQISLSKPLSASSANALQAVVQDQLSKGKISLAALEVQLQDMDLAGMVRLVAKLGKGLEDHVSTVPVEKLETDIAVRLTAILRTYMMRWLEDGNWPANPQTLQHHIQTAVPRSAKSEIPILLSLLRLKGNVNPSLLSQTTQKGKKAAEDAAPRPHGKKSGQPSALPLGEEDPLYVDNAGLVLLNPFFQPCFEALGWMEKGQFTDEGAQENAVLFLAYLGTGEMEVPESRLPLAKVLCGMELDRPVRAQVDLDPYVLEEADTLLLAANEHWKKAGKLTPAQFRESFLKREGRLQFNGSNWNLKVDRQTIDILLEFLPWGFGTIKLPWMEGLLLVDW